MWDLLVEPFVEFAFMRRALVGGSILSLSAAPIGIFLMFRRMSLAGDAMAHAVLPGAAAGFLISGLAILPMTLGGFAAGLIVAILSGLVSRLTIQREDSSLAAFYLISLALGVLLISLRGSNVDLVHVLFGTVLALDNDALILIGIVATVTLVGIAAVWRPLVADSLDPQFLRSVSRSGNVAHLIFLTLAVLNLVGGFQALGTLMSVGLMILPAAAARFWARSLEGICGLAIVTGLLSTYFGLLLSYYLGVASGPSIILVAGAVYVISLLAGTRGAISSRLRSTRHRTA
ncbi:MAG: zinc ABC transporter permease [Devosia sp. 66-22]|nr:MAG: zinc ABC transporter permease [Devosia sp. 66-22]